MSLLKHSKNNHQFLAQMEGKSNEAEQHKASKSFTVPNQWQALLVLVFRGNYLKLHSIYQKQGILTQHPVEQLKLHWKYLKCAEHTARREHMGHFFYRFFNTEPISDSLPLHLPVKAVSAHLWCSFGYDRILHALPHSCPLTAMSAREQEELCSYTAPQVLETET